MLRSIKASIIAIALTASVFTFAAGPAQAATDFANCDAMHHVYKHGVAKSKRAANRQYRTGHYRPAVRPAVYRANNESDADKDGTACEVTR
ncbi:MAG TPA: excalibur calcium-binding domain-containing protein [Nocardioidaceae bacterium]|nr:excalibur calcium-binding domain-containing protein [Nocardioidaceae bacterium]